MGQKNLRGDGAIEDTMWNTRVNTGLRQTLPI